MRLARIDLWDVNLLSSIIDEIEFALTKTKPLIPFVRALNGKNFFRILDSLFHEETIDNWKQYYEGYFRTKGPSFKKAFQDYFGFTPEKRAPFAEVYEEIRTISIALNQKTREANKKQTSKNKEKHASQPRPPKKEKKQPIPVAKSGHFHVEFIKIVGNVASFKINDQFIIDICLRGQPEYRSADRVLELISEIGTALLNEQDNEVRQAIKIAGSKAFLQIAKCFYHRELCSFLTHYAKTMVINERTLLLPRVIMKRFFGTKTNQYYHELLGMLEELIPWANDYLVSSNMQEIEGKKRKWILFEAKGTSVYFRSYSFAGSETFVSEAQSYCRRKVKIYNSSGKPYVKYIHDIVSSFNAAIDALAHVNLTIESVLDLSSLQIMTIGWVLSEEKQLSAAVQRRVLYTLQALFEFIAAQKDSDKKSPFPLSVFPKRQLNPKQPISSEDLDQLSMVILNKPEYIQIAVHLAIATGARASSICELSVEDFSYENGKWIVTVIHYKTIAKKAVSTTRVELDPILANRIHNYILQTEHLRKQLPRPYLLVYQPSYFRSGSARKPVILSAAKFRDELVKIFPQLPLYDPDGNPIYCSFMTLRATFGKELFLAGVSVEESALRMGNSPLIKGQHYTMLSPLEEAQLRHKLYDATLIPILSSENQPTPDQTSPAVMYGSCESNKICNHNDCSVCKYLITCKESKQERGM